MGMPGFKFRFLLLSCILLLTSNFNAVQAQDLEPRAYLNIPVGVNFVVAGYSHLSGGVLFDPAVPLDNANIKINGSIFAYARSIKVGSMSGKFDAILPYAWLSGTADFQGQPGSREVSGLADARVRMSVNFLGAPALPMAGFRDYKQNFVLGGSLQVYLPVGQYDPDKLVNLGTNRFTFKPELGMSKTTGPVVIELTAGVAFYTVNHDFYQGKTRAQAPIGSLQGHLSYNFKNGMWMAMDGTYYWGGHTTLDGVEGNDLQENTRFGFTFVTPINMHHSLKLTASTGVSTRTGTDFDAFAILWQYRWSKDFPKKK